MAQTPAMQVLILPLHLVPQVPQLLGSLDVSTHLPPQLELPAAQLTLH
jgi:hypothetical protein